MILCLCCKKCPRNEFRGAIDYKVRTRVIQGMPTRARQYQIHHEPLLLMCIATMLYSYGNDSGDLSFFALGGAPAMLRFDNQSKHLLSFLCTGPIRGSGTSL